MSSRTGTTLSIDNINPKLKAMEYAVRGPIVIRAVQHEKELKEGVEKPFKSVIKANIGDAHAMLQTPITFLRQVAALAIYPPLLDSPEFSDDIKARVRRLLGACGGGSVGAYTMSSGIELIRKDVAAYIERRDGGVAKADPNHIYLSGGASEVIRNVLKLFIPGPQESPVGVMIPIPQYPLYSASLAEFGLHPLGYYLDESAGWSVQVDELERAIKAADEAGCKPRAIVVINPGNPTGQVQSKEKIQEVIKFALKHNLVLLADEVYQDNVYAEGCQFHSFKKVMSEMGAPYNEIELASFMSISKGYMGECGIRGGYGELVNFDPKVEAVFNKSISAKLCSTAIGQIVMGCVTNPPQEGEAAYELFKKEKKAKLDSLAERAILVEETFNGIDGISCNKVQGAMYAFPQLHLPPKAIQAAEAAGKKPDEFYAFELLDNTGICIVPGSGFGQKPGTYHFRTTILPQPDLFRDMMSRFKTFHTGFMAKYK